MRRVVITGLGLVTPLGTGVSHAWKNLINGGSGIVSLVGRKGDSRYADLPSTVGGVVQRGPAAEGLWDPDSVLARGDARNMAPFTQYAIGAAQEALADSGWTPTTDEEKERTGVCLGSGIGNFDDMVDTTVAFHAGGFKKTSPLFVPRLLINMAAGHISMKHGFRGPSHAASTACTTGAHAIGDASRFIQFGDADVMLAGGAESCLHPLAIAGFARAKSLATNFNHDPQASSRPFDRYRCGFVMGEGSGVMILEELGHARARGAQIYAELTGYGTSSDAHHMTAPPEDGNGARRAMSLALRHAKLPPGAVDYINAHATSTLLGDAAENRAIKTLLLRGTGGWSRPEEVNVSSNKGAMGHLLGAAGAVEAIFTILALRHGILPPTRNLVVQQGGGGGGSDGDDAAGEFDCNYVPGVAQERPLRHALSNSFG